MASPFKYWEMGIKPVVKEKTVGFLYDLPELDGDEIYQRNKDIKSTEANNSEVPDENN